MCTPSRLLLAASIAAWLALPPAADGADEKLWVGTVTYSSRYIDKSECDLQNEHCAVHCKVDIENSLEFELFVVIAKNRDANDPRPTNFRFDHHWVTEVEWRRFKKLCEKRPQHYVQPGDSASEKFNMATHCVGWPSFSVHLSVNEADHKARLYGEAILQTKWSMNHTGPSYRDPCSADEDSVPLEPLVPGKPLVRPVEEWRVLFSANGIVSGDLRQITLSPDNPTWSEPGENEPHSPNLPEAPLTRTCPECVDCDRTNAQFEVELPNVRGEFMRCDARAELVRSELLSQLGECFTSRGLLPTCVPALVTCVQTSPAWELCEWTHCKMDAAGEGKAELSECISDAVDDWMANDERCR